MTSGLLVGGLVVGVVSRVLDGPPWLTFGAAAVALVPLAGWVAISTEHLAGRLGSSLGALLGATLANAIELIISTLALRRGLTDIVKASITGSIIGNTLLTLGVCAIVGGLRHGPQKFRAKAMGRHAAMMILAVSAMALPSIYANAVTSAFRRQEVSVGVALLLLATYAAYVFYAHFSRDARGMVVVRTEPRPGVAIWTVRRALVVLALAIAGAAVASEQLVFAVEPLSRSMGLSRSFIGLIVIPVLGNIAEQYSAIEFAVANRVELSLAIAANSSTQMAVFIAPLLVLVSLLFQPMTLVFRPIELVTLFASSTIFAYISLDGETNWLEGTQLLALYAIAAVAFFFLPG